MSRDAVTTGFALQERPIRLRSGAACAIRPLRIRIGLSPRFRPRRGPLVSWKAPVVMRPSHSSVIGELEAGRGEHGGTVALMLHPRRKAWVSPFRPRPSMDARVGGGWPEACPSL